MIAGRYREICAELALSVDIEKELSYLREKLKVGVSQDWLVSRENIFQLFYWRTIWAMIFWMPSSGCVSISMALLTRIPPMRRFHVLPQTEA